MIRPGFGMIEMSHLGTEVTSIHEISRSGNGAHIWVFFQSAVPAWDARGSLRDSSTRKNGTFKRDGYHRHLGKVRKLYAQQATLMKATVKASFPAGIKMSDPVGGYMLWVELPPEVDSMRLYQLALENGITIGSGYMFPTTPSYYNFHPAELHYPWTEEVKTAVVTLGRLVASCVRSAAHGRRGGGEGAHVGHPRDNQLASDLDRNGSGKGNEGVDG